MDIIDLASDRSGEVLKGIINTVPQSGVCSFDCLDMFALIVHLRSEVMNESVDLVVVVVEHFWDTVQCREELVDIRFRVLRRTRQARKRLCRVGVLVSVVDIRC